MGARSLKWRFIPASNTIEWLSKTFKIKWSGLQSREKGETRAD
jgi:hypothetical protein